MGSLEIHLSSELPRNAPVVRDSTGRIADLTRVTASKPPGVEKWLMSGGTRN